MEALEFYLLGNTLHGRTDVTYITYINTLLALPD